MNDTEGMRAPETRRPRFARSRHRVTLAIDGLPPALAALAPDCVHAIYAEPSPARDALLWQTAVPALRGPATVLSTHDAPAIAAGLRQHGLDIDAPGSLHRKANLCSLRPLPGRPGIDVLLEALQSLSDRCAAHGSQILVDGAEAFFSWHDGNALRQEGARLSAWCARRHHGVLLILAPPATEDNCAAPDLHAFHGRFAGVVRLTLRHGQRAWEVAFWRDRDAVVASETLALRFSPRDHRLMVASDAVTGATEEAGLLAPDEQRVIVARDAVIRERWIPEHWEVVDSNEAVAATAQNAVAATVIFHYGGHQQLEGLARQIHQLRRRCGEALKIVVREDGEAMRQHYELLVLNLGANLVIGRRTTFARGEAILEGIQGQLFSRPVPADCQTALSAVVSGAATGYVPAGEFVELVRTALARSRTIRLPHVLLRLPLLPEVAHVDALRACRMSRVGDICTVGSDSLYAFFFACRMNDMDAVCKRVFQRPLVDLFAGELRCGDQDSITALLETLETDVAGRSLPDYRGWLALHLDAPAAAATTLALSGEVQAMNALPRSDAHPPSPGRCASPRQLPRPRAVPLKPRGL